MLWRRTSSGPPSPGSYSPRELLSCIVRLMISVWLGALDLLTFSVEAEEGHGDGDPNRTTGGDANNDSMVKDGLLPLQSL